MRGGELRECRSAGFASAKAFEGTSLSGWRCAFSRGRRGPTRGMASDMLADAWRPGCRAMPPGSTRPISGSGWSRRRMRATCSPPLTSPRAERTSPLCRLSAAAGGYRGCRADLSRFLHREAARPCARPRASGNAPRLWVDECRSVRDHGGPVRGAGGPAGRDAARDRSEGPSQPLTAPRPLRIRPRPAERHAGFAFQ